MSIKLASNQLSSSQTTPFSPLYLRASIRDQLQSTREVMENIKALAALFQGQKGVPEQFPEAFDRVYDKSCQLTVTSNDESSVEVQIWSYDDIYESLASHLKQGFKAQVIDIDIYRPPNSIKYTIRLVSAESDITITAIAEIKRGKLVKVTRKSTEYDLTPLLANFRRFFDLYDGDKPIPSYIQNYFDAVFDDSIKVIRKNSPDTGYEGLLAGYKRLLEDGYKIDVQDLKVTDIGIEYTLNFQSPALHTPMISHSVATVKNGRIVQVEAAKSKSSK